MYSGKRGSGGPDSEFHGRGDGPLDSVGTSGVRRITSLTVPSPSSCSLPVQKRKEGDTCRTLPSQNGQ